MHLKVGRDYSASRNIFSAESIIENDLEMSLQDLYFCRG